MEKLLEVTRWGNAADGGDGPDTNWLVLAADHLEALDLVRGHERASGVVAWREDFGLVTELGTPAGPADGPVVLRGPYVEHALERGLWTTQWQYDAHELLAWVPCPRRRGGEARCHYRDGRLAAVSHWLDGSEHGPVERWYADGQRMHRGHYDAGNPSGLHEYWFDNGQPAGCYRYDGGGVSYRRWDREGRLVGEAREDWLPPGH